MYHDPFIAQYNAWCTLSRCLFTPHICDVSGVIVLTSSVCLSVALSRSHSQTDRLTDLNFGIELKWKDIQVQFKGQFPKGISMHCLLKL